MIKLFIILILLNISLFANNEITNKAESKVNITKNLNRAKAFFEYGNYQESINILNELLKDKTKLNSSSLLNIYQLIARAEYYNKNEEYSEFYLKMLYLFKSDYHFDPVFVNPEFIDFANNIYIKYKPEIIKNKNDLSELLRKKNPENYGNINTEKYFYKNFIPFGIGQFQNGHKYKGYMLMGLETLFLTASVTTYALLKYYQGDDYTFENKDLAYSAKVMNNISFYMLGAVYLYATIDAIVYYNASDINVIQSKNFQISPVVTPDFKYVLFKWSF